MKQFLFCLIALAIAMPGFSTTKTVGQSGADFTSIQAAIDSFTEAQVTDGEPDAVEILDGAEYDEQIMIGGLVPNPSDASPTGYLDDAIDLANRRDPFTIRGADPDNRPKINPLTVEATRYGVFTNNGDDNFIATFSFIGKNITVENVEILRASTIDNDQYALNGQAGNMTFNNVLFGQSGEIAPGEDLVNFNNAADIAGLGFDNSYTFKNCVFDGAVGEERGDFSQVYFYGYSESEAADAGVDINAIGPKMTFHGCKFLNGGDNGLIIRGRGQANDVLVQSCYVSNQLHGIVGSGKGTLTIQDSIFHKNQQAELADVDQDAASVELTGRDGYTPELILENSLFIDNMVADDYFGAWGGLTRGAAVLLRNDGNDPDITIRNCTFVNNPIAIRFLDAQGRPRNAAINDCIFQNCISAVLTADDPRGSYLTADTVDPQSGFNENLVINGVGNIFDGNYAIVEDNDLLPNVVLEGEDTGVTFNNALIDPDDPYAGPPYLNNTGKGGNLEEPVDVKNFMLF